MNKVFISFFLLIFSYGVYAKPAANVRLLRKIEDKDEDETITDENGYFEFKAVYQKKSLLSFLPVEFVVKQDIVAFHEKK